MSEYKSIIQSNTYQKCNENDNDNIDAKLNKFKFNLIDTKP